MKREELRRAGVAVAAAMLVAVAAVAGAGAEAPPAPQAPSGLRVADVPDDAGHAIDLRWVRSADDTAGSAQVRGYRVLRAPSPGGPWSAVDTLDAGTTACRDVRAPRDTPLFYRVAAFGPGGETPAGAVAGPVVARAAWFDPARATLFVVLVVFAGLLVACVQLARAGRVRPLRRLPAVDAIEEAAGRAAEAGRPLLVVPGSQDIDDLQTVAGLSLVGHVARRAARRGTALHVPVAYPVPFTIAQELVRGAAAEAGEGAAWDPLGARFVSPDQFAFAAAVAGIMERERPAASLFLGAFHAESLLLAESGAGTGAVQVAGTANVAQVPFFVVACDHTLVGEELFAASAYLSDDPRLAGSVTATDVMRLVIVVLVVVGCVLETCGIHVLTAWLGAR